MIYTCSIETPLGLMRAAGNVTAGDGAGNGAAALTGLWFEGQKHFPVMEGWLEAPGREPFPALREWLTGYFAGQQPAFPGGAFRLAPQGSPYQRKVWAELEHIPYGQTLSYGELAARLGSAARAVGNAVGRNPISILIPCHRVTGAHGELTGYAGGLERKEALLKLEQGPRGGRSS